MKTTGKGATVKAVAKTKPLGERDKVRLIQSHEDGSDVHELATKYGITPFSVAAYVANAHRSPRSN